MQYSVVTADQGCSTVLKWLTRFLLVNDRLRLAQYFVMLELVSFGSLATDNTMSVVIYAVLHGATSLVIKSYILHCCTCCTLLYMLYTVVHVR